MRPIARYSLLEHRRNEDILQAEMDPVEKKLKQYEQNCLVHVRRMKSIIVLRTFSCTVSLRMTKNS
jgi:hypothetical protein